MDRIQRFLAFWNRRSKWGKGALITGAVLVVAIVISAVAGNSDEKSATPSTTTAVAETSEPPPPPAPLKKKKVDTGRMSDAEFESWTSAIVDLTREGQELSSEYQTCSVIGQTGDLVGFRDCVKAAYRGVEDSVDFAEFTAQDLLDDTAKQCRAALRSYLVVSPNFGNVLRDAYDMAYSLDFDAMPAAFNRMPPATRRWSKFSTNAVAACQPE